MMHRTRGSAQSCLNVCLNVAIFSGRLAPAKRNNGVGNRELLAVKLTLEEWWHWLEILVRLAQSRQPDPGKGPPNSLFVPEVDRSQILHTHTSPANLALHTLWRCSREDSGGPQWILTCGNL